ncbi:U32 family peptidase [Pirellulaceae bacterium]|nr:U32 family peptidase [Pirellulaceae bacterium]
MHPRKPELMSPAGHWPQLLAAIESGADAVYFGLNHFSARAKVGFELEELPEVFATLHSRSVKGFVTFNTLVFDDELGEAEKAIVKIAEANADAIIVQDIGIAQLCQRAAPNLVVHGSTQMSVTSAQGAELAKHFGCSRVVLARELSLKDIANITKVTDVELESFVHGALCVSYSGQCFSSEAWGGRSANRGQCAQACRLSYDLIVDGQEKELGEFRYLLSPGDLYAIEQVPDLIRLGISCLKIEGRYKDESYVALTTRAYREAIDKAMLEYGETSNEQIKHVTNDVPIDKNSLEQVYSRGLGPHFMSGVNHQLVVDGRAPRHRGLRVGTVARVSSNHVEVEFVHRIKAGDGIVFDAANWRSPNESEEGGSVFEIDEIDGRFVALHFGAGKIDFSRIRVGDLVWRNSDPAVIKAAKPIANAKSIQVTRPIRIDVYGESGNSLRAIATFAHSIYQENGIRIEVASSKTLQAAKKNPLSTAILSEQLGRLGGTPFHLADLSNKLSDDLFLPLSVLNDVRRELVAKLEMAVIEAANVASISLKTGMLLAFERELCRPTEDATSSTDITQFKGHLASASIKPEIHLLIRSPEQLDAAIGLKPASITLDYLDLYGLRPSVEKIRAADLVARVASPRVLKPAEQNIIKFLTSLKCPILVRSGGLLFDLIKIPESERPELIGDFSLNAANVLSALTYLKMGLSRITPTHDLNAQQIAELCRSVNPQSIEVVALHHLPVFHMEHCVFCRFLSDGTDNTNCGHPCETHQIRLRDQSGRLHPVVADVGCRNTVFGAESQWAGKHSQMWLEKGLRHFRLEFVDESGQQVSECGAVVKQLLNRKIGFEEAGRSLAKILPAGTTTGSLFVAKPDLVQLGNR